MKTVIRLFFSLLIVTGIYSCDSETENVSDSDETFQVRLNDRLLNMDSFDIVYSENADKHTLDFLGYFTDYKDSSIIPSSSKLLMELIENRHADFNPVLEEGILQSAIYTTGAGFGIFEQETKVQSELFESGLTRDFILGSVKITSMDAEEGILSGYFNLMATDSTLLSGNFFNVPYTAED